MIGGVARPVSFSFPRCPMPPRLVVAAVVVGWLATLGWLAHDKWLPWLRPADEPAFVVEMADEVAPEHFSWTIFRKDKRTGTPDPPFPPPQPRPFPITPHPPQ